MADQAGDRANTGKLAGRAALITGATAGIGRASAALFAAEGAAVTVVGRNAAQGGQVVSDIRAAGGRAIFVAADVTSEEAAQNAVDATLSAFGRLDILYNNVGGVTAEDGPLTDISLETFWDAIKLNLFGTWNFSRVAIPRLLAAGGGTVINTVSGAALRGRPGGHAYAASKGAVVSLTRAMAVEYAPTIRVNAISPTKVLTERVRRLRDGKNLARTLSQSRELLGWGEPIDVARAALFLACDDSKMTTGHILPVDSGTLTS